MNINEIVYYPTQLQEVTTTKIRAEIKGKLEKEFNISASTDGIIIDSTHGKSIISICIENKGIIIEETKEGIFTFETEIADEEEAKRFMEIQGVRILWSYIREDIYTISSKMIRKPIMIPTIDVMKTLEKAQ